MPERAGRLLASRPTHIELAGNRVVDKTTRLPPDLGDKSEYVHHRGADGSLARSIALDMNAVIHDEHAHPSVGFA
jgi:hypothetical protein